ncbi:hypothetical protein [Streptomyces sp. NPDC005423]|uniref:hypothetical protein n=1 Tax=Streptomyces sp. NPDC005423 TaxID=3155343 RepID=UPI0033AAD21B
MAKGDGVANQEIRVRLDVTADTRDVGALMAWLAREGPLEERVRAGELRIDEGQPSEPEPGAPMGMGAEIVVVLVGSAAGPVFSELVRDVRRAVEAWRGNRREVEHGESPGVQVDVVHSDDDE